MRRTMCGGLVAAAEAAWHEDQSEEAYQRIVEFKRLQAKPVELDDRRQSVIWVESGGLSDSGVRIARELAPGNLAFKDAADGRGPSGK